MTAALELDFVEKIRSDGTRRFRLAITALTLAAGSRMALVGPSGCGKSTAIDLLALCSAPDRGRRFRLRTGDGTDVDVTALWREKRSDELARLRRRHFGYVVQTGGLLPFLSVRENVLLPQRLAGRRDSDRVAWLADRLGIARLLDALPSRLSVGQRQRVAIARALAAAPDFILADEPTAALDPSHAREAMGLLVELVQQSGAGLLLATHAADLAVEFGVTLIEARSLEDGGRWTTIFHDGRTVSEAAP